MNDKAFASLTSGLLARKGHARPAMRPQAVGLGWNDMGYDDRRDAPARKAGLRLPASLSGPPEPVPEVAPAEAPVVVRQQDALARQVATIKYVPAPAVAERAAPPTPHVTEVRPGVSKQAVAAPRADGRKSAFTLRLDTERHLRLRLACAVQNRSAQQLVTEAVDRLLEELPDIARLAAMLPEQRNASGGSR